MMEIGALRWAMLLRLLAQVLLLVLPAGFLYGRYLGSPTFFDDGGLRQWIASDVCSLRCVAVQFTRLNLEWGGAFIESLRAGNLFLHLANSLLVWRVGELLLSVGAGPGKVATHQRWIPLVGAALFAIHPVASYATAYVIQRTILLAAFFALSAIYCHVRGHRSGNPAWFGAAVLAYALAVFSKEHVIMLPAVLGIVSYWLCRLGFRWSARWHGVWLLYAAIAVWVMFERQHAVALGTLYEPSAQMFLVLPEHPHLASVASQVVLFFKYLLLWILPNPQWMSIDLQHDLPAYVLPWGGLLGGVLFLGVAVGCLRLVHRAGPWSVIGVGGLGAMLLYATEFWAVRFSESFVLYRSYVWLPLAPMMMVFCLARGLSVDGSRVARMIVLGLVGGLAVWQVHALNDRLDSMTSPMQVWRDAVEKNEGVVWPGVARAYANLGIEYARAGDFPAARHWLEMSIAYNAAAYPAHCALATLYFNHGNIDAARRHHDLAARYAPTDRCVLGLRRYLQ